MLSRFDIAFLPRSKHLLISWLHSPSSVILELPKIKSVTVSIVSPSICHEVMGVDAMVLVFWAPKSLQMVTAGMKLKESGSLEEYAPRQHTKKQRHYFVNKGPSSQNYGFSSSHVWMRELDYKES